MHVYNERYYHHTKCGRHDVIMHVAGTAEGGEPLQLAVSISAGACSDWTVRREYPELLLCCSEDYEYFQCDSPTRERPIHM